MSALLSDAQVFMHPHVVGELACGNLKTRAMVLDHLKALPQARVASDAEVLKLSEAKRLWGRGLGWTDMHLIASALLTLASALLTRCHLWTLDKRLAAAGAEIGI